eukprot:jgi/Pico_ML_1/54657/g544.t1
MHGDNPIEQKLIDWHYANLEYANAAPLGNLSLGKWDQDDPFDVIGEHCFLAGGNARLIQELAKADDSRVLGEPVKDTVFFAGEATTPYHPSTMHGAFFTGLREAVSTMPS